MAETKNNSLYSKFFFLLGSVAGRFNFAASSVTKVIDKSQNEMIIAPGTIFNKFVSEARVNDKKTTEDRNKRQITIFDFLFGLICYKPPRFDKCIIHPVALNRINDLPIYAL